MATEIRPTTEEPTSTKRWTCPTCGKKFTDNVSSRADHLATHNPNPAEWTEAHRRITAGKERAKPKQPAG